MGRQVPFGRKLCHTARRAAGCTVTYCATASAPHSLTTIFQEVILLRVELPITEPSPDDWPHRQRIKRLLRAADVRGLRETLLTHSQSLFGKTVWSLDAAELDDLAATFETVFSLLDEQLSSKDVH